MKFVNPKNDVAFKKIFGSEDKTHILISFLNAVLGLTGDKEIQQVRLLNPYQTPKLQTLKMTILDIRVVDKRNISYIIEMQLENVAGALKRFTYYATKAYVSQIDRGEDYPKLNQVIFIGILDFILFDKIDAYLTRHQVLEVATQRQELQDLEFAFVELPKFTKQEAEISTLLDKWLYFIKHAEDLAVIPPHVDDPALQSAYQVADQFGWSKEDLEAYEYRGMRMQDARGAVQLAHEQGFKEGEQSGLQKGEQLGLKKGEQLRALETARRMRAKGYSVAEIVELTGLSAAEIETLE